MEFNMCCVWNHEFDLGNGLNSEWDLTIQREVDLDDGLDSFMRWFGHTQIGSWTGWGGGTLGGSLAELSFMVVVKTQSITRHVSLYQHFPMVNDIDNNDNIQLTINVQLHA